MGLFDVRVFAIRRRPGHKMSEVRWRVAGHYCDHPELATELIASPQRSFDFTCHP